MASRKRRFSSRRVVGDQICNLLMESDSEDVELNDEHNERDSDFAGGTDSSKSDVESSGESDSNCRPNSSRVYQNGNARPSNNVDCEDIHLDTDNSENDSDFICDTEGSDSEGDFNGGHQNGVAGSSNTSEVQGEPNDIPCNNEHASGANSNRSRGRSRIYRNGRGHVGNRDRNNSNLNQWKWELIKEETLISKIDFTGNPGVKRQVMLQLGDNPSEFDTYRSFFTITFWQSIATETNRYAAECILEKPDKDWFATNADEIEAYFALSVLMAQVKKNTLQSYWSKRAITSTPFFSDTMPRSRFYAISKYLHIANTQTLDKSDRISKLRPVVDFFNKKFADVYKSEGDMSLDESLMKCRGRLSYIQFNPSKRARFGIKFYKLCKSASGYCFSFEIYTGKKDGTHDVPVSEAIVLQMMAPYENEGHTLYLDNWYSSPNLFLRLHEKGTNAVGTVRCNRKNMPEEFRHTKEMKKGDARVRYCKNTMALQWIDKKPVTLLSTVHDNIYMEKTGKVRRIDGEEIHKPRAIIDYNRGMGGVDRQDQQLSSFPIMRRYLKVYKKIFFYILDMAVFNAYVLYQKTTKKKLCYDDFRLNTVEQLFDKITLPDYRRRGRPSVGVTPLRLQSAAWAHFPRHIPPNAVKQNPSRRCVVCSARGKKSESRWECKRCEVALHLPDCFEIYHTQISLK